MKSKSFLYRSVVVGGGATIMLSMLGGPAFATGNGYAPPPEATGTAPGGYSQVVLNESVPTNGGTLVAAYSGSAFTVQVPAADAGPGVTLAITAPTNLSSADNAILGFGIALASDGVGISGNFSAPVAVVITNPNIHAGDQLDYWTGSAWAPYSNSTVSQGVVKVTVTHDPQFALVSASVTSSNVGTPIPNSTSPHTGVPINGLLLLSGLSLLGGAAATTRAMRLRHRSE